MSGYSFTALPPTSLDKSAFVARYGGVYEHSPWIAKAAYAAGLNADCDHADGLSAILTDIVEAADEDAKLALLRAHPDLAGKLAVAGELTEASTSEQAGAGLDQCTAEEFEKFQSLNERYKTKFGFPFILAVAGYRRGEILEVFERRTGNAPEEEMREALKQVHRIALIRLQALSEAGENE